MYVDKVFGFYGYSFFMLSWMFQHDYLDISVLSVLFIIGMCFVFLTHFYLLKSEEPPVCIPCDQLCSIEHLLTECVDLLEWRRQFFNTESLECVVR